MIKVTFKRICGCVMKNELEEGSEFSTKEEALTFSRNALETLKDNSCRTHNFFIEESEDGIVINSELNLEMFSIR